MKLGIDGSRAFLERMTGVEFYSLETIKALAKKISRLDEVIIYVRKGQTEKALKLIQEIGVNNFSCQEIPMSRFFTQVGLSFQMIFDRLDALFVPAHTVPLIHPKNTIVVVHGLEFEHCPESYGFWSKIFHRFFIRKSCVWAKKVIAISNQTKKDLEKIYRVPEEKIKVVYNGFSHRADFSGDDKIVSAEQPPSNFLLFIGRLEERKNIRNIIKAFEFLKNNFNYQGKLILVGRPGIGYEKIRDQIRKSEFEKDIIEKGYIEEAEKWEFLTKADVFLFPSLSEGFGLPILEAQSVGTPVVTSNFGPMDEVAGNEEILVNPIAFSEIASLTNKLIRNISFRNSVVKKGFKNVENFSWDKCAEGIWQELEN